MNTRLLRKVAKHISEEPRRLAMSIFADTGNTGDNAPPCGTIGCIAGWASILTGTSAADADDLTGRAALKLTLLEARRLFWTDGWPDDFSRRYWTAKTCKGRASTAVARIEHFIKTKGAE